MDEKEPTEEEVQEEESTADKKNHAITERAIAHIRALEAILVSFKHVDFEEINNSDLLSEFLNNILNGINPITGEIIENNKGWNDPVIINDIKSLFSDNKEKNKRINGMDENKKMSIDSPNQKEKWPEYKRKIGILDNIRNTIKSNYDINIVVIQSGFYFSLRNEDAEFFNKHFNLNLYEIGSSKISNTGFPIYSKDKYINKLIELKEKFCFVEQKKEDDKLVRYVTFSTDEKAIDIEF